MSAIHIPEAEVVHSFDRLLAYVQEGRNVIIDRGAVPIAILTAPAPVPRTIEQCLQMLPDDPSAVLDEDFAQDVQEFIDLHREPLNPPAWD